MAGVLDPLENQPAFQGILPLAERLGLLHQKGQGEDKMVKKFLFRGHDIDELKAMSYDEFSDLLLTRQRRSLRRGLTPTKKKLLERVKRANDGESVKLRTHCRDMIVVPQMVDQTIEVHNGKEFMRVLIQPEMIGHYLGEFSPTRRRVNHGTPGMGATKSSLYIPLK